jgi:hypothetical protein
VATLHNTADDVECSTIMAHPRQKIPTLWIRNTRSETYMLPLHFSIFCQTTEFSYGPRLKGGTVHIIFSEELKLHCITGHNNIMKIKNLDANTITHLTYILY